MTPPYPDRLAACRGPNDVNRLHIECDTHCPPPEIAGVAALPDLPQASRDWLARLDRMAPGILARPQPFRRQPLTDRMALYRGADRPDGRRLLIAFCGVADRLMAPLPVFLQHLDAQAWDVLWITPPKGAPRQARPPYLRAGHIGQDIAALAGQVRRRVPLGPYRSVVSFGVSSGGFAALMVAVWLRADLGVALASGMPEDALPLRARLRVFRPRLIDIFGADHAQDSAAAARLAQALGVERQPVAGLAYHNVLHGPGEENRIARFLPSAIDPAQAGVLRPKLFRAWRRWRGAR